MKNKKKMGKTGNGGEQNEAGCIAQSIGYHNGL